MNSFSGLCSFLVFPGCQGPPGTQNERFWLPKWTPKAPKMVTKTPQQTPKIQHKRSMLKSRIQILQGHSKEDLRQKGAAAVFRAACSIRRSTAGRVRQTFIHYVSLSVLVLCLVDFKAPPLSHFWYHELFPSVEVRILIRGSFSFKFRL